MSFKAKKTAMLVGLCFLGMITAQQASAATESVASVQQTKLATGQVTDSQGPLIGATVMEKGTGNGTVTNFEGKFSLNVKPGATLVISYVGYETQEIKAGNNVHVNMKEDGHLVNEVVVIGYGTQRREAVTGSVANIGGEKLNQVAATNAAQALQGRVAGVLMTQTSSKPGAEMQIRIRGQRSLTASNDPLIVLDGIPFMGALSDINPTDIKSMDILKDASATAIYGSRGANGVIIITTVRGGTQGAPAKVTYNGYVSFKKVFHKYPMMDGPTFNKLRQYAGLYQNSIDENENTNTDWQDLYYQTGISYNHDLSVAGGTNGGSYSFGAGYYKDESVVPTEGYDRISIRGNFDQTVGKWFRFGLSTNSSYRKTSGVNNMYAVLCSSPLSSPYDENGNLKRYNTLPADDQIVITKDVVERDKDIWLNENKGVGSYNTLYGEVKCPWVEGLSYRINIGLNFRSSKSGSFTGTGVNNKDENAINGGSVYENQTRNWAVENLLTYDHAFGKHNINLVGMYSAEQTTYEQSGASAQGIPADYFQYYALDKATGQANLTGYNYWQSGLMSWMGRAMYSYDNKYMLSVAVRSDASSRLAKGHQWHTYPAISAGWNIARESFMENLTWIDNLKLRVGYGETSNQSINPYSTLGGLGIRNYNFGNGTNYMAGYYVNSLPNPELGWEYSKTWNFGLDFSLFNGRLSGSFEYYIQKTNDILLSVKLPDTSGVSGYTGNIGKTENKGWEFTLNGIIIDNKNGWNWEAGINLYANRNKLVALASGADRDEGNLWFVGHPIDVIYDYQYQGLWNQSDIVTGPDGKTNLDILEPGGNLGMIKVKYTGDYDANGMPTRQINADDRQIMSMEPDLVGGFNTTVGYKGFDLTMIGAFQIGGKLISAIHSSNGYLNMLTGRRNNLDVDYWTEENTGAKYPKPGGIQSGDNPKYGSTLGYFNAGYLKIRAITLGYNFANLKAVKNLGISRLRLYATVQNPFVLFSSYNNESGLDPETNSWSDENTSVRYEFGSHKMPIVGYNTPSTRNFIFGLNMTF
ncbi:MAG: TonB-dependent receptor [Prevotella sp.]|nr:TonB-dependent receptor [Prevotella sp.]